MTLHQFAIFAAIAKHGNVTKASEELHITQPGVSQQMRLLQEEYGTQLYQRTAKGITLTQAGERFLTNIKPILDQVTRLKTSAVQSTGSSSNGPERLVVGGTHSTSAYLVPAFLSLFRKANPAVEIECRTNHGNEIERLISKHDIEIALTTRTPNSQQVAAEPFRRERFVTVVSRHHRLASATSISLRDLQRIPFLVRSSGHADGTTVKRLKSFGREHGININIAMRFESSNAIKEAIYRNVGIGIIYEHVIRYELRFGLFKVITIPGLSLAGQSYIIYPADEPLSKPATGFLNLLRSAQPTAVGI